MRIAYFTSHYSTVGFGPARMAQYFREYNGDLLKITFFTDDSPLAFSQEVHIQKIQFLLHRPGYWIIRSWLFYRSLRKSSYSFDLIICSNAFEALFLVFLIKKTPVIVMINDDNYIFTKSNLWATLKINSFRKTLSRFLGFYIEKLIARKANQVITCSNYLKEISRKSYQLEDSKIQLLYPSVDLDFFIPQKRNYFQGTEINILFVKHDWRRGGLDILVEGLARYKGQKKLHLHIVGPALQDKNLIIGMVNKSGFTGTISFYGILDKNELLNKFYQADIFILLSRQEAFGISILEALATGTPVIASHVGGISETLNEGNAGFIIEPDSPNALTAILNNLIQDPGLVYAKMENGLIHCKKFSKNNLYSNFENLILSFTRNK